MKLVSYESCRNCRYIGDEGEDGYSFPVCRERPVLGNLKSFPFKKKMVCFQARDNGSLGHLPYPSKHPEHEFMRWLLEIKGWFKWKEWNEINCRECIKEKHGSYYMGEI